MLDKKTITKMILLDKEVTIKITVRELNTIISALKTYWAADMTLSELYILLEKVRKDANKD